MDQAKGANPRENDYIAYRNYLQEGTFLPEASRIAFGACKQALTLDFIALKASNKKKLSLKTKEKALLRAALYELYFMNTPRWVVGQEWGHLAKKYCHASFAGYLNALIRNLPESLPEFSGLSVKYSYPQALIDELLQDYPQDQVEKILLLGNLPARTFARVRPGFEMLEIPSESVGETALSPKYYIMNKTPAALIASLAKTVNPPKNLLDLCASPGGKLIALHDLFPAAELYANDVSEMKLKRLQENIAKYNLKVHLTKGPAQDYPEEKKFDLVVLDVPCSNTGVFAKHPEARFRKDDLVPLQKELLAKALRLVTSKGHIFFLTCSILKKERPEEKKMTELQILPDETGADGGYGAVI